NVINGTSARSCSSDGAQRNQGLPVPRSASLHAGSSATACRAAARDTDIALGYRAAPRNKEFTEMATTAKQLVDAANAVVPKISGKEAQEMVAKGAVLVDIRDSAELAQTGKAAGAVHIPRGSLEFKADLSSPSAEKALAFDKPIILHCASGG